MRGKPGQKGSAYARRVGGVVLLLLGVCTGWSVDAGGADRVHPQALLVLGPTGRPVPGAGVFRTDGNLRALPVFDAESEHLAITDGQGRILELATRTRGRGRLVVYAPGMAATLVPEQSGSVTLRLLKAAPSSGRVRVVRSAGSRPLGVLAVSKSAQADLVHRSRVDASGRFVLPGLYVGAWQLFLRRVDGRLQSLGEATAGGDLGDQRPAYDAAVRGLLLNAEETKQAPVASVVLRFTPLPGGGAEGLPPMEVKTDAQGAFLADGLAPGVYQVSLEDRTYAFDEDLPRIEAERGRTRELPTWFARRRTHVRGRVVDLEGVPVQDVRIELHADPSSPPPPGGYGPLPLPVTTTREGRFVLRGVTPAEGYRLLASRTGYSPWISHPFRVDRATPTELRDVRLRPGWRLEVRVRDARGNGIPNADVVATAARRPSAAQDAEWAGLVRRGTTDATGTLLLSDLPEDDVLCRVRAPGMQEVHAVVAYPRVDDRRVVELTPTPGVRLSGAVLTPEGGPVGPFRVRAIRRDGGESEEVAANAQGAFVFPNLGETATDLEVRQGTAIGADGEVLARLENVVPGVEEHVDIVLPVLHGVRGQVYGVVPEGPAPVLLVENRRYDALLERYAWEVVRRESLAGGEDVIDFEVLGLPTGHYTLRALQGDLDSGAVSLQVGEDQDDEVELQLPGEARIAGTVLGPSDAPVLGARIRLTRLHGEDLVALHASGPLQRTSNERGDFVFDGIAPGLWRLEASDREQAPDMRVVRVQEGEVVVFDDLRLGVGGEIVGRLEDDDGRALDGVHVLLEPFEAAGERLVVRSDDKGLFRARNLRPGTWRVRISAATVSGGPQVEAVTEVVAGGSARVDFRAEDEGSIAGLVTREGRAVSGALVDLLYEAQGAAAPLRRHRAVTGADGRFRVERLPAGAYRILLQSGALRTERHLELQAGDALELDLEAWPGVLRGVVRAQSGAVVPGAHVEALLLGDDGRPLADARFRAEGLTDPAGAFLLRGVPIGTYTVSVSALGRPPGRYEGAEADLPAAAFDIEIVLGSGGDLNMQVRDGEDRGVTGARIWLETAEGVEINREAYVTGANGRLRIAGVPAGRVLVRVHARGLGRPGLQPVTIEEGRQTDLGIVLQPAGSLHLRVGADEGDPAFRTRVDLLRAGSEELIASRRPLSPSRRSSPWGFVPQTGELTLPDLAPGDYLAVISAGRAFGEARVPVHVESGEVTHLHVTLVAR